MIMRRMSMNELLEKRDVVGQQLLIRKVEVEGDDVVHVVLAEHVV